jgi:hypothetical protein
MLLLGAALAVLAANLVAAPVVVRDQIAIEGVGCGVPASADMALPAGLTDVRVRRPAVGDRDGDARLTGVAVQPSAVTFTAVADGDEACQPNPDPSATPPAERRWFAVFDAEVAAKHAAPVAARTDWTRHPRFASRPRTVGLGFQPGLGANNTVRNVTWRRFGGRTAIGFGTFKASHFLCPSRDRCITEDGDRVKVKLTLPGYCATDNIVNAGEPLGRFVFYGKIAVINRHQLGVLKPGTEFESYKPHCFPGNPVRLR